MNSPYNYKFQVTQIQHPNHDGLDLVGLEDKTIHATTRGVVWYAGWQNSADPKEGFGQYVCIKGEDGLFYYYGHLSEISVKMRQDVKIGDKIGVEGYTGHVIPDGPGGSHCHYCVRPQFAYGNARNVSELSGIPNKLGVYDDGYRPGAAASPQEPEKTEEPKVEKIELKIREKELEAYIETNGHKYSGLLPEV